MIATKKGKFWERYEFRGSFSRLAKVMKNEFKAVMKNKRNKILGV